MSFWTEIHWHEGMFLRPQHLQRAMRWVETVMQAGTEAVRPFSWGFLDLHVAREPLDNFAVRVDHCVLRFKDGTWASIPENMEVPVRDCQQALDVAERTLDVFVGIPHMQEVRANSIALETPERVDGSPRYEPRPITQRDENTGGNPQTLYVRRMRGRLFFEGEDMTGYETIRLGRLRKSDRPGAVPELDEQGVGPLLSVQASPGLSGLVTSLVDQIESKCNRLGETAREHQMEFSHDLTSSAHLTRLLAVNEGYAHVKALLQSPVLHPYDVYVVFCRLIGLLSVFHIDLLPRNVPAYDHDHPHECLGKIRKRLEILLDAVLPTRYEEVDFKRVKDDQGREGLQVELKRSWIDENLDMYVGIVSESMDTDELKRHIADTFGMKLASPKRAPGIHRIAVSGLNLQVKSVPPTELPRRRGLHYFRIDRAIGSDRTDYWRECEQEGGIRIDIKQGQLPALEGLKPKLYVILKAN